MNPTASRLANQIQIPYAYDVCFGRDVFSATNQLLAGEVERVFAANLPVPTIVFLDEGLAQAQPNLEDQIANYLTGNASIFAPRRTPVLLPGGEPAKGGMAVCLEAIDAMRSVGICRQSCVLVVGGGAFQDTIGLAAALYHRGVRTVRLPSTVLSQNDSGVGVKNGVNLSGVKNLLGTFAPPALVVNDLDLLNTLTDRDWVSGAAEAFKVALIRDAEFAEWLIEHAAGIPQRDPATMEQLVQRCASLHVQHIATSGDPFEFGSARPLDFGHWSAHKLESLTNFAMRHGEAVAIGLALDLCYAVRQGFITQPEGQRVIAALHQAGLPIWDEWLVAEETGTRVILAGIHEFREHLGGELHVTFPCPIGCKREVCELDTVAMLAAIDDLRQFASSLKAIP